jgi:hypothetical protein
VKIWVGGRVVANYPGKEAGIGCVGLFFWHPGGLYIHTPSRHYAQGMYPFQSLVQDFCICINNNFDTLNQVSSI